jgi:hypothetical protein
MTVRDLLLTPRTRRAQLIDILTPARPRDASIIAGVARAIAAGSLTTIDAETFGCFSDAAGTSNAAITAGGTTLTSDTGTWSAGDAGKPIDVAGAGAAGATLRTSIASFTDTDEIELADAAATTVAPSKTSAGGLAIWGDDYTDTIEGATGTDLSVGRKFTAPYSVRAANSTTTRTQQARAGDRLSVLDFGAVGDGSTDDSAAIQAACVVCAARGKTLYFPAGVYLCAGLAVACSLVGEGNGSILRSNDDTVDLLDPTASDISVRHLRLEGVAVDATNTTYAIRPSGAVTGVVISGVTFSGETAGEGFNNAIKIEDDCDDWRVEGCSFERLWGTTAGHGYGILCANQSGAKIYKNTFVGPANRGRHAVYMSAGTNGAIVSENEVNGFSYEAITTNASGVQDPVIDSEIVGNIIRDCVLSGNASSGAIGCYGLADGITIRGNIIRRSGAKGIAIDASGTDTCTNITIVENDIEDVQTQGLELVSLVNGTIAQNGIRSVSQASVGASAAIRVISDGTVAPADLVFVGNRTPGTDARSSFQINATSPIATGLKLSANYFPTQSVADYELNGAEITVDGWIWATAAPSAGAHVRGDRAWNTSPSAAGVPGWVCTASGTPGTWKAMAALSA